MELAVVTPRDVDDHQHPHHNHHAEQHQSQSQYANSNSKAKAKKTFTLETYLAFLSSHDMENLTVEHLGKILSFHGYKKLKNRKQSEEAVRAITEPIHPGRSTLKDSSSTPSARKKGLQTLTEAIKDLKLLNWQECSVTSIRIISPKNHHSSTVDDIPTAEVAAKLMSLKGSKRCRSPMPQLAGSLMTSRSGQSKSGSGSGGRPNSLNPDAGINKKKQTKRKTLHNILSKDTAVTTLAATSSST